MTAPDMKDSFTPAAAAENAGQGGYAFDEKGNEVVEDREDGVYVNGVKVKDKPGQQRTSGPQQSGFAFDQQDEKADDDVPTPSGKGWIRCADGRYIRDNGGSLYIKGVPPSREQIQMVRVIAAERGWTELAAWKGNHRSLDPTTTRMLEETGAKCCHSRAEAGNFGEDFEKGIELWKNRVMQMQSNATDSPGR